MIKDVYIRGIYIDECDDSPFAFTYLIRDLKEKKIIKGSTYIEYFSTKFHLPFCRLDNKEFDDVTYEIHTIDNNLLNYYRSISNKTDLSMLYGPPFPSNIKVSDFDNRIFIIKDDPDYSSSSNNYVTETMIIDSDKPFIINIGYRSKFDVNHPDYEEVKKLFLFNNNL